MPKGLNNQDGRSDGATGLSRRGFIAASRAGGLALAGSLPLATPALADPGAAAGFEVCRAEQIAALIASAQAEAETRGFAPRPLTRATPQF